MRIGWAAVIFYWFILQWQDVVSLYSDAGILPRELVPLVTRTYDRITVLDYIGDPQWVIILYLTFLGLLLLCMAGVWPRITTILCFLLLQSFHEDNPLILGGGDTVLRTIGLILCVAPGLRAVSVMRLREQWRHWKKHRTLLPPVQHGIWVFRLLLWQALIIYVTSVWFKAMGEMWINLTATTAALQHEWFVRWPREIMRIAIFFGPLMTAFALAFESAWALLLIPRSLSHGLFHWTYQPHLKRALILLGFAFHGGIFLVMDVGSFSLSMFVLFMGLLLRDDIRALKAFVNRRRDGKNLVFFDGYCGLCLRSVFTLQLLDWLKRLQYVDFRDSAEHQKYAPDLKMEDLDRAMHVRLASGKTLHGFDAFRALSWHLPPLWPLAPFLYLPGISFLGRRIYAQIAARRNKCAHEHCAL